MSHTTLHSCLSLEYVVSGLRWHEFIKDLHLWDRGEQSANGGCLIQKKTPEISCALPQFDHYCLHDDIRFDRGSDVLTNSALSLSVESCILKTSLPLHAEMSHPLEDTITPDLMLHWQLWKLHPASPSEPTTITILAGARNAHLTITPAACTKVFHASQIANGKSDCQVLSYTANTFLPFFSELDPATMKGKEV